MMGLPGTTWNPIDLDKIEEWASLGCTEGAIAGLLRYNANYFCSLKKQIPEISEAIARGRSRSQRELLDKLKEHIADKNLDALKFALKSIHKFTEATQIEVSGTVEHKHDVLVESHEERMLRIQELQQKLLTVDTIASKD